MEKWSIHFLSAASFCIPTVLDKQHLFFHVVFSRPATLLLASKYSLLDLRPVWYHRFKITHRTLEKPAVKVLSMLSCTEGLLHIFSRQHSCLYIQHTVRLFCNIMTLLTHVQIMLHCNPRSPLPESITHPIFGKIIIAAQGINLCTNSY